MKKLMLILLVGLGLSISAQSQTRCKNDTAKICSMDSTKDCMKDSTKTCPMNVTTTTKINIDNNYYNGYDDVYYSPYGYYGNSWFDNPWYWSYPIIIDRNGRRHRDFSHRHKEFIGGNKNFNDKNIGRTDNKPIINQHRTSPVTDGRNRNEPTMYNRPQMRGQMNRPFMEQSRPQMQNRPQMEQNRPQMQSRPPMQQSRPAQQYSVPPTQQRQSIRRGSSVEEQTNEELVGSFSMEDFIKYNIYKE